MAPASANAPAGGGGRLGAVARAARPRDTGARHGGVVQVRRV
jgi:hypothetical protein